MCPRAVTSGGFGESWGSLEPALNSCITSGTLQPQPRFSHCQSLSALNLEHGVDLQEGVTHGLGLPDPVCSQCGAWGAELQEREDTDAHWVGIRKRVSPRGWLSTGSTSRIIREVVPWLPELQECLDNIVRHQV